MLNKANNAQRIVLAIFIPIVLFLVGYGVMYDSDISPEELEESWGGWVMGNRIYSDWISRIFLI